MVCGESPYKGLSVYRRRIRQKKFTGGRSTMKRTRKGFTLIELLIVVAIMGALAAMMASSSADSIDSAQASAILNNLQSMKTAAYDMYMNEPAVAGMTSIANDTATTVVKTPAAGETAATYKTVGEVLGEYLGRIDIATNYGIVGNGDAWYVFYTLQDSDSAKVKTILANKANAAGLLGAADANLATLTAVTAYYVDTNKVIALRVR